MSSTSGRRLSLHHLTVMDVSPVELIDIAYRSGCQHVCFFIYMPIDVRHRYPMVGPSDVLALREAMLRTGVTPFNLEVFPLSADAHLSEMVDGLALGSALGARHATVHVHEENLEIAAGLLQRFCAMAEACGITVGLEYNSFSKVSTPASAMALVNAAGCSNLGIIADFLHTVRSGAGADDLAAIHEAIGYAQICDGLAQMPLDQRWREAISDRMVPGTGDFALSAMVAALPDDIVIDVEVPQRVARENGVSAWKRAREAVAATRLLLDRDPWR